MIPNHHCSFFSLSFLLLISCSYFRKGPIGTIRDMVHFSTHVLNPYLVLSAVKFLPMILQKLGQIRLLALQNTFHQSCLPTKFPLKGKLFSPLTANIISYL